MTNSFNEFSQAKMFLVIGSNMTEAHPVASTFVKNAVLNGGRLIVVDPRRHKLVDYAEKHVPIRVGSDIAFLNGLMNVLIAENLYDRALWNPVPSDSMKLRPKWLSTRPSGWVRSVASARK